MNNVVLVVDDGIFNYINKKMLERMRYFKGIHTALNGKEALDLFNNYFSGTQEFPDIILLDLNMPIMDGFGFLEAFRKLTHAHKNNVKIIIVISSTDPGDVARAQSFGVTHYLTKPLSEERLWSALKD